MDGFIVGGSGGVTSAAGNRQNGNPANRNDSGRRDTSQERVLTNQGMSTAASVLETTPKNNGEVLQSPGPGVKVAGGVCIIHREEKAFLLYGIIARTPTISFQKKNWLLNLIKKMHKIQQRIEKKFIKTKSFIESVLKQH